MGLRLSDAVRLSWTNVTQHKKQSAILVATISLLFGIIMGVNFVMSGLERSVIKSSVEQTHGDVYVRIGAEIDGLSASGGFRTDKLREMTTANLKPAVSSSKSDTLVRERIEQYGGELIGYTWFYQLDYPFQVIDRVVVEPFIDEKLMNALPKNKVPVIMPENWEPDEHYSQSLQDALKDSFYKVGTIPDTETGHPTLETVSHPLNIILERLPDNINTQPWLIDDGSNRIVNYIKEQGRRFFALDEEDSPGTQMSVSSKTAIAKFSDPYKAAEFVKANQQTANYQIISSGVKYYSSDAFGTTASVAYEFGNLNVILTIIEVIFLVAAVIITVFTFAHLVDDDAQTVALYRSMGASTDSIYVIYLCYLLELCLLSIAAAILIGLIISGVVALTCASSLSERLAEFYNLATPPEVSFIAITPEFWWLIVIMLCVAPPSLLFSMRRFSAAHVAKKLKED